jgi:hypothetical protein
LSQIKGYFPDYDKKDRIRQVDMREIVKKLGIKLHQLDHQNLIFLMKFPACLEKTVVWFHFVLF